MEFNSALEFKISSQRQLVPIEDVNDGVFSAKNMGDGVAIIPEDEMLIAPADGEITVIMEGSFHTVGMKLENGVELLLHIGIDTVSMNGDECPPIKLISGMTAKAGETVIAEM